MLSSCSFGIWQSWRSRCIGQYVCCTGMALTAYCQSFWVPRKPDGQWESCLWQQIVRILRWQRKWYYTCRAWLIALRRMKKGSLQIGENTKPLASIICTWLHLYREGKIEYSTPFERLAADKLPELSRRSSADFCAFELQNGHWTNCCQLSRVHGAGCQDLLQDSCWHDCGRCLEQRQEHASCWIPRGHVLCWLSNEVWCKRKDLAATSRHGQLAVRCSHLPCLG